MTIREIQPDELVHYKALCLSVFFDMPRRDIYVETSPEAVNTSSENIYLGAFSTSGKLLAGLLIIPYTMLMHGKEVKMGGISGVVTHQTARGQGLAKKLMAAAITHMHSGGYEYSFLYPFNFDYYRQFGYELCLARNKIKLPVSQFTSFPYPKQITQHSPGQCHAPFDAIYSAFISGCNFATLRSSNSWEKKLNRNPYTSLKFSFYAPDAYILYTASGTTLKVDELCWRSISGLHDIFGFIGKLSAEFYELEWNAPNWLNLQGILPNPYDISMHTKAVGMARVIDLDAALSNMYVPCGSGACVIEITDPQLETNNGIFTVKWQNGAIQVSRTPHAAPSITTQVQTLLQLISGYTSPACAALKQGTVIHNAQACASLFVLQNSFIAEDF